MIVFSFHKCGICLFFFFVVSVNNVMKVALKKKGKHFLSFFFCYYCLRTFFFFIYTLVFSFFFLIRIVKQKRNS
ncbi:hypothetical protein STCU_11050 [Strigomonas culicis]|uniref:Uncharacterized protein n=1 Tax=Strigomonas culicis TaxID=28005 RepID=S9TF75_9TRYP|nr:hypothetical protein STCU_11050 [Strigomonas culicis]|eukprot:EPY16707.1 hypothetical protein STCU_11050 [Strigomonas culicis]